MLMKTRPEHLFAWLSVVKSGAVACPVHTDLAPSEIAEVLAHLEPSALIYDAALAPGLATATSAMAAIPLRVRAGDDAAEEAAWAAAGAPRAALPRAGASLEQLLASKRALTRAPDPGPNDIAEILTTSGTTGRPKSAMIPHRMPVLTGEGFASWLALGADDRLFTCLPLSHVNARGYSTFGALAAGASLAIEERFSASRFWGWLAATGATQANAIGAMLNILLDRAPEADETRHAVRLFYSAPALGAARHEAFESRFRTRLVVGYGLTESTYGFIHPLTGERDLESMGRPRRHPDPAVPAEARLVADAGEPGKTPPRDAGPGEPGEVWLKNPASFAGYFRNEAATRETVTADGWLRTGDLAQRDERGDWFFIGRAKLVIRRRGENMSPGQIESVLEEHPAVLEAGVVGVPAALGEEDVRAYVVLRPGAAATEQELEAHCASRLAAFKVPTQWRFLERLPRTPTQRVAYHLLPRE